MGDTDLETMANVTIAEYDYEDEAFDSVSQEARDFIDSLLVKDQTYVSGYFAPQSSYVTYTESFQGPGYERCLFVSSLDQNDTDVRVCGGQRSLTS